MAANNKITQEWLENALDKDMNTKSALLWSKGKGQPFGDTILNVLGGTGEIEGSFQVHKLILALGSRKFATELYSTSPDEIPREIPFNIEVNNVSTYMMEMILEFLYTDAIERHTEWPEVGGLIGFARQYGIPRLRKFCTDKFDREIGQRCEQVLETFREFISWSKEQYKWQEGYYKEIVKLCLSYILRNGDVILRSSNFRNKLSIENIELFIGSDYFCIPSETLVFHGLKKWARAQCRKKGMEEHYIEDIKKVLRKPNEDNESLGLLKYVRFPVFTEDEFHSVNRSSDLIIPKKIEDLVHRYHVSEEPTGIFSEKRRPVEVDAEDEDFQKHLDELISNLPAFATASPEVISEENNSYLPILLKDEDDPLPNSSQSVNEKQLNVISIKQEVDTDTQSYIPSIPDHISVGTSTSQNSPWSRSSCASTPAKPMSMTQKRTTLKRTGNEAELTDTKKVSPIKIMKIKKEAEDETTPYKICDLKQPTRNRTSTGDRQNDGTILKNQLIHTRKVKYSGIVEECSKNSHIAIFVGNHFEIDLKAKSKCQSVCMPQLRSFSVEASLDKKTEENLVKNLANINLEDLIFFYHDDSNLKNRLAQIWAKKIKTTLKLCEVIVFHANAGLDDFGELAGELTINYTKKSSFFSLNGQGVLNDINVLNLGNCKLNQKCWLPNEISEKLVELRLFRVKDLDLRAILGQCKSLKVLCVWAVENQVPTICLNDIASENLRTLSITGYMIKFDPDINNSVFPKCVELSLVNHSCDPVFTEMMPKTFPKLRKLSVLNELYPPETDFLLKITSGSSLEEIFVWNFEVTSLQGEKALELKSLVKNYDLIFKKCSSVENCSFRLKRRNPLSWKGENVEIKDLPHNIFVSFGLDCFYTLKAFKKLIWTDYI